MLIQQIELEVLLEDLLGMEIELSPKYSKRGWFLDLEEWGLMLDQIDSIRDDMPNGVYWVSEVIVGWKPFGE